MATSGQVNKGGISAAMPYSGPTVFHTGGFAPTSGGSGTDTTPATTETYVSQVYVPVNARLTGVALLNGTAVAGNVTVYLYDSSGAPVASSASTAQTPTGNYQKIPFSSPYEAKGPAAYYIGVQFNSTSARFRSHIIGTFPTGKKTGETYGTPTVLTVPTAFTADTGPIADTY